MARRLEAGDSFADKPREFLGRDRSILHRHYGGHNFFAVNRIRKADHRAIAYIRMVQKRELDLPCVNVLGSRPDHRLLTVDQKQEAVLADAAEIPGMEPASLNASSLASAGSGIRSSDTGRARKSRRSLPARP